MDSINAILEKLVEERIQERDRERIAKVKASNIKNYMAYRARNLEKCKELQKGYYHKRKNRKLEEKALAKQKAFLEREGVVGGTVGSPTDCKNKILEEHLANYDINITLV